jgi:hypothetical protein
MLVPAELVYVQIIVMVAALSAHACNIERFTSEHTYIILMVSLWLRRDGGKSLCTRLKREFYWSTNHAIIMMHSNEKQGK